jgi:acetolactate synthase small subunit
MRRILSVLLENESGALSRVIGLLRSAAITLKA